MIIPCEVAVRSVIPAVKALMAKELVERQGLKQDQVAVILGISQSAVSKYAGGTRGHAIEVDSIKEIHGLIGKMTALLASGDYRRGEFLEFFCQTCMIVRKKNLMCVFCMKTDPAIEIEECDFCAECSPSRSRRQENAFV